MKDHMDPQPSVYRVTDGHDWDKPPVATVRVTPAMEAVMLEGGRYFLDPIIQTLPEHKVVGFSLVPVASEPAQDGGALNEVRAIVQAALDRPHGRVNSAWLEDVRAFHRIMAILDGLQ